MSVGTRARRGAVRALSVLSAVACVDYGVQPKGEGFGEAHVEDDTGFPVEVEVHDAAAGSGVALLQRTGWGTDSPGTAHCMLEVGLWRVEAPPEDPGSRGAVITLPREPGTCAYTAFSETTSQAAGSLGSLGTLDAGWRVLLSDAERQVELRRVDRGNADVTHYLADPCEPDSYPAGRTFALEGPGSAFRDGLPPFRIDDALAVGPDLQRIAPTDAEVMASADAEGGTDRYVLHQRNDRALELRWTRLGDAPLVAGRALRPSTYVVFRHFLTSEQRVFETLVCRPEAEGAFTLTPDHLAQFVPDDGSGDTMVALQVEEHWVTPRTWAPWGGFSPRSFTSWGGMIYVLEAPT